MDMKKILQAMDGASTKPVEGSNDMSKFLSIIDKNDVSIIKEEVNNNKSLNEGANPHKVSLPVQMAMQHYATPAKSAAPKKPSLLKQYFAEAEQQIADEKAEQAQRTRMYAQKIANRVLVKETKSKKISENQQAQVQQAPRDERTIQQEIKVFQKQADKVTYTHSKAREITKEIKYDDTASNIISRIRALAATDIGIDETELKYAEEEVFNAIRALESSVYGLEQVFEDAVRAAKNKVDDLESEIDEIQWEKKYGRQEEE